MLTLAVDASAGDATVAVLADGNVIATAESFLRDRDVEHLLPAVTGVLEQATVRVSDVRRVVCGDGPGGFTALRLAAATAKGIVRGTGAELWVTPSLALIVAAANPPLPPNDYLALLDALRGECYAAHVSVAADGGVTRCTKSQRMTREAALEYAMTRHLMPVGPNEVGAPQASHLRPHARGVARLAWDGKLVRCVDPAEWEPEYGRLAEAQLRWEQTHQRALEPGRGGR